MDFDVEGIYQFLFGSMPGIGCLVGATLIVSIIACIVMERRTRRMYQNHEPAEDDWFALDDDEEETEDEDEDAPPDK